MSSDVITNQPPQNPVNSPAVAGGVANPIVGRGGGTPPSIEKLKQRMFGYRERQKTQETTHQNTTETNDIQVRPTLSYALFRNICSLLLKAEMYLCVRDTLLCYEKYQRIA